MQKHTHTHYDYKYNVSCEKLTIHAFACCKRIIEVDVLYDIHQISAVSLSLCIKQSYYLLDMTLDSKTPFDHSGNTDLIY